MPPIRVKYGVIAWLLALLVSPTAGAGVASLEECFDSDRSRAEQCELHVAGIYHAFSAVQARYGLAERSCQYPRLLEHGPLFERMRSELRGNLDLGLDVHMNAIIAAALLQSTTCTMGLATEPDGYRAAGLIHQCQTGTKDDAEMARCAAYVRGLYEGLQQLSGYAGARDFTCPPSRGLRIKDMLKLVIDEALRDPDVQQLAAAEVMAMAMARKYPCRSER